MLRVRLYGELRRKYFVELEFAVHSVSEAISAIAANFKGFTEDLATSGSRGVTYVVRHNRVDVPKDALKDGLCDGLLQICPVVQGQGGGTNALATVAGIALLVAGYIYAKPFMMLAGAATLIQSLFPPAGAPDEKPENTPSGFFNGPVNTVQQGHAVPIGYGKVMCGSAVVSSGLTTQDRPTLTANPDPAVLNP